MKIAMNESLAEHFNIFIDKRMGHRLFNNALLDLMMSIASAVMPENGIPPTYQRIREKYMQAV